MSDVQTETSLERVLEAAPPPILRRAAVRATLAPSVHNSQPWRFVLGNGRLDVHADYSRQLRVADRSGRQLAISCGCALLNARVSLSADGYGAEVTRFAGRPGADLLARVRAAGEPDTQLAALDPVLGLRRTNRRPFASDRVPSEVVEELTRAAGAEGAQLVGIEDPELRMRLAALCRRAENAEYTDAGYRTELRSWVTDDPARRDGVPLDAIPHRPTAAADRLPIRDFDVYGRGILEADDAESGEECLLVLGMPADDPVSWIRAGEALERLWLEATRQGYALTPFTQPIEVESARSTLRRELAVGWAPQVMLRVGRAQAMPATRRRRLVDVLREVGQASDER